MALGLGLMLRLLALQVKFKYVFVIILIFKCHSIWLMCELSEVERKLFYLMT